MREHINPLMRIRQWVRCDNFVSIGTVEVCGIIPYTMSGRERFMACAWRIIILQAAEVSLGNKVEFVL
ncbi:hypothetical protein DWB63_02940 [Pseudodesulfovibrio sp. S3]|nr:hypothetical protein DWB63_02940 [Pseudodesulfovibrio sp. S3]